MMPAYASVVRPELPDAHHTWGWRRKAREGRSASRREDPIHLGAATRQREGAIRRAERRRQWAEAWEPRSGSALSSNSVVGQRMAVSFGIEFRNSVLDGAVEVIRTVERLMSEVMP